MKFFDFFSKRYDILPLTFFQKPSMKRVTVSTQTNVIKISVDSKEIHAVKIPLDHIIAPVTKGTKKMDDIAKVTIFSTDFFIE